MVALHAVLDDLISSRWTIVLLCKAVFYFEQTRIEKYITQKGHFLFHRISLLFSFPLPSSNISAPRPCAPHSPFHPTPELSTRRHSLVVSPFAFSLCAGSPLTCMRQTEITKQTETYCASALLLILFPLPTRRGIPHTPHTPCSIRFHLRNLPLHQCPSALTANIEAFSRCIASHRT